MDNEGPEYPQRPRAYTPRPDAFDPAADFFAEIHAPARITLRDFTVSVRIRSIALGPEGKGASILVSMITSDRDNRMETTEIDFQNTYAHVQTKSDLLSAVRDLIILSLKHEVDERLFCDGERVKDPHR